MVFISYSYKNRNVASRIHQNLVDSGIKCWMSPESIVPGKEYAEAVKEAISSCTFFLILLSEESQKSNNVENELTFAIICHKTIIPLHIDKFSIQDNFSFLLTGVQVIEFAGRERYALKKLLAILGKGPDSADSYDHAQKLPSRSESAANLSSEKAYFLVFISYSYKNRNVASRIHQNLVDLGIKCWMSPESIVPGKEYAEAVKEAISSCTFFLILLSEESQKSNNVENELTFAIICHKTIIPLHIDGFPIQHNFSFLLTGVQVIEFEGRERYALKKLLAILGKGPDSADSYDDARKSSTRSESAANLSSEKEYDNRKSIERPEPSGNSSLPEDTVSRPAEESDMHSDKPAISADSSKPEPYSGDKSYVFLSYSHRDAEAAINIVHHLQSEGFRVWYDEGVDPGSEWDENIASHVEKCGYFIALLSRSYLDSSNCKDELNYAREEEKPRLLIYLEEVQLPSGMRMRLSRLQAIHRYKYNEQKAFYKKLFAAKGISVCRNPGYS